MTTAAIHFVPFLHILCLLYTDTCYTKQNLLAVYRTCCFSEGWDQWKSVDIDPETTENWINVTDLDPGSYEFRMIAVNGFDDLRQESRSSIVNADVGKGASTYLLLD